MSFAAVVLATRCGLPATAPLAEKVDCKDDRDDHHHDVQDDNHDVQDDRDNDVQDDYHDDQDNQDRIMINWEKEKSFTSPRQWVGRLSSWFLPREGRRCHLRKARRSCGCSECWVFDFVVVGGGDDDDDEEEEHVIASIRIPMIGLGFGVVVIPSISWIFPTKIPIAMSPTRPRSSST